MTGRIRESRRPRLRRDRGLIDEGAALVKTALRAPEGRPPSARSGERMFNSDDVLAVKGRPDVGATIDHLPTERPLADK